MKFNEQIITIKRRIKINNDDKLKSYLFDNCIYRDQTYNDFVDAVNDFESKCNNLRDFSPRNYAVFYYNEI